MSPTARRGAVVEQRSSIRRRMQRRSGRAAPQLARRSRRPRTHLKPGYSIGVPALTIILLVAGAAGAAAHPLGNFTVNTYSGLRVGPDRLTVDHVVDMAEIPTFQTRQTVDTDQDDRVSAAEADRWRDRECRRLAAGLKATVDGRAVRLAVAGSALRFPEGVGGLPTLRLECALAAPLPVGGRTLSFTDGNDQGRVGWREITAVGDRATLAATDVPAASPNARLTRYPEDQLSSPLDQRTASLRYHPGGPPAPVEARGEPDVPVRGPPEGESSRRRDRVLGVVHSPGRGGQGQGGPGDGGVHGARG